VSKTLFGLLGLAAQLAVLLIPAPGELSVPAWHTAGLAAMMALFWIGEVMPLAVTALLPLLVAPLLGIEEIKPIGANYGHPLIFLFLGGFVLGLAMERWNLHRRIALTLLVHFGGSERRQLAAFMLATALLSMWVSNTATAIMMLPIAVSVITQQTRDNRDPFAKRLLLSIAYSASIGGLATLIGTPPNALMAAYLSDHHDISISFVGWMAIGLPLSSVLLLASWWWLGRRLGPVQGKTATNTRAELKRQLIALGPLSVMEKRVAGLFVLTAALWILRPLLNEVLASGRLTDTGIALAAALALHLVPAGDSRSSPLMDWKHTQNLPWGVLLLFGGGLALAGLMSSSGLAEALATGLEGAGSWPVPLFIVLVVGLIIALTEVTSNTATAAAFLPLLGALALSLGLAPEALVVPAALAASCAFMLPVATPPNAIVFGANRLTVADMARAGLVINLMAWALISLLGILLL